MKTLNPDHIQLTPKTRRQIAEEYGIHRDTLRTKLKKQGFQLPKGIVMPKDIRKIYNILGWPEKYKKE